MDLTRSTTVAVLGALGVVIGAVGLVSFGWAVGALALAVVLVVASIGFWRERDRGLHDALRFKPIAAGELDPIRAGVDRTAPWLLEKTDEREGEHLLSFVSRTEARALGRKLAPAVDDERSVVVALVGESKAGKTRCMFELVRQRVPDALVFAPLGTPDALREVVAHRRFRSHKRWSVLWLDDLEDFDLTGNRGVDDALLDELLALPRVVVAVTAGARWGIERLDDAPSLARLAPGQGDDAQRIVRVLGQALADAIGDEGLGAACVAGPDLIEIHASGRHPRFESGQAVPEGSIVVECLIAATRVGLGSLTRERLAGVYRQSGTAHASPEGFARGLRWALTPLYGEVSLVLGPDDAFRVYPYLAENAAPIGAYRDRAEQALAATVDIADLVAMAAGARERCDLERAARLYELALPRIDDEARQAAILGTLGNLQEELGRFEAGLASQRDALAIKKRVHGEEHHEIAMTLGSLGFVQQKLGRFDDALVSYLRALEINEREYGEEHPRVASTLTCLADAQRELGRFDDALVSLRRALVINEQLCGEARHRLASTLNNLGIVHKELGRLDDALASHQRALAIDEEVYGKEHHAVARTLGNLGNVQLEAGDLEDALGSLLRALSIFKAVYGKEHHLVATCLTSLGSVERSRGHLQAALASQLGALDVKERIYGKEHHTVAITLGNLGNVQSDLGHLGDALASKQRALAICERVYGEEHHEVARALTSLAITQRTLGQTSDAEANARSALAIFEAHLSEDHPQAKLARRLVAQLVAARGEVLLNLREDGESSDAARAP